VRTALALAIALIIIALGSGKGGWVASASGGSKRVPAVEVLRRPLRGEARSARVNKKSILMILY
jgi:hypothetical protein